MTRHRGPRRKTTLRALAMILPGTSKKECRVPHPTKRPNGREGLGQGGGGPSTQQRQGTLGGDAGPNGLGFVSSMGMVGQHLGTGRDRVLHPCAQGLFGHGDPVLAPGRRSAMVTTYAPARRARRGSGPPALPGDLRRTGWASAQRRAVDSSRLVLALTVASSRDPEPGRGVSRRRPAAQPAPSLQKSVTTWERRRVSP